MSNQLIDEVRNHVLRYVMGEVPLDLNIRIHSDSGKPVALDETTPYGKAFQEIAAALAAQISIANFQVPEEISIE